MYNNQYFSLITLVSNLFNYKVKLQRETELSKYSVRCDSLVVCGAPSRRSGLGIEHKIRVIQSNTTVSQRIYVLHRQYADSSISHIPAFRFRSQLFFLTTLSFCDFEWFLNLLHFN